MINKKDLLLQRSLPSFAKIYFLITLSIIMCSGKVLAQKTSTLINSDPPGVILSLEGEYRITATTPCRLPENITGFYSCLLYTSPSPRDLSTSRMPSSA